jgi:hypothetical protein
VIRAYWSNRETHRPVGFAFLEERREHTMSHRSAFALLALLVCARVDAAALTIEPQHANFGSAISFSQVEHEYRVSNTGERTVRLLRWLAVSEVGEVVGLPDRLEPGASSTFKVVLPIGAKQGRLGIRFALFTDEPEVERYRFTLSGFAWSLIEPERPVLDFGQVEQGHATNRSVELSAREAQPLRLGAVIAKPDWVDVAIDGERSVRATLRADAPAGMQGGVIHVATGLTAQPTVEIGVAAIVDGPLRSSNYALVFEPVPAGDTAATAIDLRSADGEPIGERLQVDAGEGWRTRTQACETDAPDCLRLRFERPIATPGVERGRFVLRLGASAPLEIPWVVMGMAPGQTIRELRADQAGAPASALPGGGLPELGLASPAAPTGPDAGVPDPANARIADVGPTRTEGPGPVRLEWTARNAMRTFGFLVYRSTDRGGPFQRMSAPIHATDGGRFAFVDEDVEPGNTYYYYVDSIDLQGRRTRFSPTFAKTVTAPSP